jgi:hypothetical protein
MFTSTVKMPSSSGLGTENFMLIVSGPTQYASFLSGWQEFKDHIRRIVNYQPGWAEVMPGPAKGEMQGWCRLEKKADADAAYGATFSFTSVFVM